MSEKLASGPTANLYKFGFPIYSDVDASTPRYSVKCTAPYRITCDFARQSVPIPADAKANTGSDGSLEIVDPTTNLLYSFWQAHHNANGSWSTSWGTIESLSGSGTTTIYNEGANTGSGMSEIAGVVTLPDLASGQIDHALSFSSSITCSTYVAPANKSDGATPGPNCLPEGSKIQLDPSINLAAVPGITPLELMVGRALQGYGAFCKDTGGAPLAIAFQEPTATNNPYPALGAPWDYWNMPHIPWNAIRIVND